ncbi:MAG: hypothetical protein QUS66_10350, partial [Bacteroidota bacterium]|nr:hypothetical protein [Bacteroidota bacterium]
MMLVFPTRPSARVRVRPAHGFVEHETYSGALYATDTGATLADSMLPSRAVQPTFSPDGTLLTFLDYDPNTNASVLATMRWDPSQKVFSDHKRVVTVTPDAQGMVDRSLQWPTFLPDSKAIIVADVMSNDLYVADIATGTVT